MSEMDRLIEERDELRAILDDWDDQPPPGMLERLAELNERIETQ